MRKLINFLSRNKVLIFILLMGLIPLIWFKDGLLITGGDFPIPLDPVGTLKAYLQTWFPYVFCGEPNMQLFMIFPWFGFWALFKALGFSLLSVNKFWFVFICMLTGLSMYYLVSVVFEKKNYQLIALTASLFYMFNVYIMLVTPLIATPILYAGLPLILGLYIKGLGKGLGKGLREKESSTKYAILIGIASQLIVLAIDNPTIYAICGIMVFSYLIHHLVTGEKKGITRSLIFTLKTAVIFLLINFWWLYPYTKDVLIGQSSLVKAILQTSPGGSPFFETFRLFGSWAFYAGSGGAAYFPFAHYYKTPFFLVLTFILPILAFSAVFFRSKNKYLLYFLDMAVVGVFLAHGAHGPSGAIFTFLFYHIPGFWIFREPFAKFTVITAASFAVLIGFSTDGLYRLIISRSTKAKNHLLAKAFVVCVLLIILTSAWPILTGDLIFSKRGEMKSLHVAVPDYWFEAGEWFNNQKGDFRILVLPYNPPQFYCGLPYKWGYGSADITPYLIHQPLIEERSGWGGYRLAESYGPFPPSQKLMQLVYSYFNGDSKIVDLKAILSHMNVRYILQRNDVEWGLIPFSSDSPYSPEHIKSILGTQEGIHLEKTFGELDVYKIDDEYFLPHIYAPKRITYFSDNTEDLANIASFAYQGQDDFAFLRVEQNESFIDNANRISIFLDVEALLKSSDKENSLSFMAPKEGSYEVLFKLTNQPEEVRDFQSAELEIDGKRVKMTDQRSDRNDQWFLFGETYLAQGNHKIKVGIPITNMQISDFEADESWTAGEADTSNFKEGEQGKKMTSVNGQMIVSDRREVNYDLRECDYIDVWVYADNIKNLEAAIISFGNDPSYYNQYYKYFQDSITSNGWNHLHIPKSAFNPGSSISSWNKVVTLRIAARSKNKTDVNLTFDDWNCRSRRNVVAFRSEDYGKSIKTPNISFTKIDPTRYEVNIQNAIEPFFLVFSESYHSQWKAFTGGEEIGQHLVANGYANAWHISKTGTYKITLDYQGKRLLGYGVVISLVTLLISILYLTKVSQHFTKVNPPHQAQKKC